MAKSKRHQKEKTTKANPSKQSSVRDGGTRLSVPNSGLEVWLYDDANREMIRQAAPPDFGFGGMPPNFCELTKQGLIVGYSLMQDDYLDIAVYVGAPLTEQEMSMSRWLEPQKAFLRLPSGKLCVESNDASRIGPEEPTEKGGLVQLAEGDYLVTLYRIDHEALDRERLTWKGPQEVIVLTPGGNATDAADDLLPFEPRRDTTWVGNYKIEGKRADALVWFSDYWDTFIVNLDSAAASKLSLVPGSYFRTQVPTVGITLVSAFDESWHKAQRLPAPTGMEMEEYGYGAFCPMSDWDGAEALFCRRDTTKTRVEDEHQNIWIPAIIEIIDVQTSTDTQAGRTFAATQLQTKSNYYDDWFLGMALSDVIPEAGDSDELELSEALEMVDIRFGKMGLTPQGDLSWEERLGARSTEMSCRLYTGPTDCFGAILASAGCLEILLLSELDDGTWVVTGFADEIEGRLMQAAVRGEPVEGIHLQSIEDDLKKIFAAHKAALRKSKARSVQAPTNLEEVMASFERFLTLTFA